MDFSATQIYDDEDFPSTQRILCGIEEEDQSVQVGTLSIDSVDHQIKRGILRIGRLSSCGIVISDPSVSKVHAEIEAAGGSTWICDLESSNKTKLNNLVLRPKRSYELKDRSVIEFGKVRAIYRAYQPDGATILADETPAPSRKKAPGGVIPGTPDSSLNTSSGTDGSIVLGTQGHEEDSVFRRPLLPQHRSPSADRKILSRGSTSESDDAQGLVLHVSDSDASDNRDTSIFDAETQTFGGVGKNSVSIHDMETQRFSEDDRARASVDAGDKSARPAVESEVAATDICDLETQKYTRNISELETQVDGINAQEGAKNFITSIHDLETQVYVVNNDNNAIEDKGKDRDKRSRQVERDISDLETQNFGASDISDLETQVAWNSNTKNANRDISDVETQLEPDGASDDRANVDKDKIDDTVDNARPASRSGSCSPTSLNLSSPGVDEDRLAARLNQSDDYLESSELLEFFNEGIENQVEAQTSTPKPKASSERNNNVAGASLNVPDNEDQSDDDNIFEAPTQRLVRVEAASGNSGNGDSGKREKPRSKGADSDETDAEEDLEAVARNSENEPSAESMYDLLTQKLNDGAVEGTSPREVTRRAASPENPSSRDDRNVTDDAAPTQIIDPSVGRIDDRREDLDRENEEYEMAPTQVIGEIEEAKGPERDKTDESAEVSLNDTLERNLNEMFDNVTGGNIEEEPQMLSTQILEDILESSCDNDLSAEKSKGGKESPVKSAPTKKARESHDRSPRVLPEAKTDSTNNEHDDSDIYFSNITTRRKRNVIRDTQEFDAPAENTDSVTSSRATEVNDDKIEMSAAKREECGPQKNKNAPVARSNDDDASKDGGRNDRKLRPTRQRGDVTSEENKTTPEASSDRRAEVDDGERSSPGGFDARAPCPSRDDGQRVRAPDELRDSDDDILTRLPAVRISGTLSNPPSPSASSTSSTVRAAGKRAAAPRARAGRNRDASVGAAGRTSRRQRAEDPEAGGKRAGDRKSVPPNDDHSSTSSDSESIYNRFKQMADRMLSSLKDKGTVGAKRTEEGDARTGSKRQKAGGEPGSPSPGGPRAARRASKRNDQNSRAVQEDVDTSKPVKSETKLAAKRKRVPSEREEGPGRTEPKKYKAAGRATGNRATVVTRRRTSKAVTDERSPGVVAEADSRENSPILASNKPARTAKAVSKMSEDTEKTVSNSESDGSVRSRTSNARQTRSKFPSIVIKTNSKVKRANPPAIGNADFPKVRKTRKASLKDDRAVSSEADENADIKKANVKQSGRKAKGRRVAARDVTEDEGNNAGKQVQAKGEDTRVIKQEKILKIQLTPIKSPVGRESQEVEVFMKDGRRDVQDEHLSIRRQSSAKILSRASRARNRKRPNADNEVTSVSESSSVTSDVDSGAVQPDASAPRAKRGRTARNSVSSQSAAQIPAKEETFKRPTRVNRRSANSVPDSSPESSVVGDNQDGSESDASSSSRSSRSKAAKGGPKQSTPRTARGSASSRMNTSADISFVPSTPSRARRSASVLSNSSPGTAKHRILFTGIAEDYGKLVKTLGGTKVEEPAKCTVLVTDKIRRTYKFLCALAMGIPIVAIDWLRDSEPVARFLDWENYILKDPAAEAKFSFRLRKSLEKAKEKKLLDGYTVLVTPNVAPPPIEELKDMVTSCGGKVLLRPPTKWPDKAVVVSREEDLPNARKFIAKAPKTVTVQSTEFILTGILRQEADFDKYKLL